MTLPSVRAWRIEHARTRVGPYHHDKRDGSEDPIWRCGFGCDNNYYCEHHWPHPHPLAFPEPSSDRMVRGSERAWRRVGHILNDGTWHYAARDYATIRRFFGPLVARHLHDTGYVLRAYRAPWDAHMARRANLLFDPDRATLLCEYSLLEHARQLEAELAVLRAIQVAGDIEPLTQRRAA
jgi:hypothetical protein